MLQRSLVAALNVRADLAEPTGWRGPNAAQFWQQRAPLTAAERAHFLAALKDQRLVACDELHLPLTSPLGHYPAHGLRIDLWT